MKYTITLLLSLIVISAQAQPVCCNPLDSCTKAMIGQFVDSALTTKNYKKNDSLIDLAAVIAPYRVNGINHWNYIVDGGDHDQTGFDTTRKPNTNGYNLVLYFKHPVKRILSLVCGVDETMGHDAVATDGTQYYTRGGYMIGARVYKDSAVLYLSKIMALQSVIQYDSASNTWSKQQVFDAPFNILSNPNTSNPIPITCNSDGQGRLYLDVKTDPQFKAIGYPVASTHIDNAAKPFIVYPMVMSKTWVRIYFKDGSGNYIMGATPPNGLTFIMNWGYSFGQVDWATEDVGVAGNFWLIGKMKYW